MGPISLVNFKPSKRVYGYSDTIHATIVSVVILYLTTHCSNLQRSPLIDMGDYFSLLVTIATSSSMNAPSQNEADRLIPG